MSICGNAITAQQGWWSPTPELSFVIGVTSQMFQNKIRLEDFPIRCHKMTADAKIHNVSAIPFGHGA
jgi:hypothetical protein